MANIERMHEAVRVAVANAKAAKIMRELAEREVARYAEAMQEAMRRLIAAEAAEEAAEREAEYAHEVMMDAEIATHEEYLASLDW